MPINHPKLLHTTFVISNLGHIINTKTGNQRTPDFNARLGRRGLFSIIPRPARDTSIPAAVGLLRDVFSLITRLYQLEG